MGAVQENKSTSEWLISIPQHQMLESIRLMPMITFINAIGDRLEEADQISIGTEINGGRSGLGHTHGLARRANQAAARVLRAS